LSARTSSALWIMLDAFTIGWTNLAWSQPRRRSRTPNWVFRTAVLVNGGAAVSVLAFAGGLISQGKLGLGPQASDISFSLLLFALGVLAGALGIGFAYFTNYCVTGHYQSRIKQWEQPYLVETPGSRRWAYGATFFRTLAIACGFVAAILFVSGVLQVRNAITQTGEHAIRDGS
jgi:hypothetical protein